MNTIKTPLEAKHFIDSEGKYLGAFAGLSVRTVNDKGDLEDEYIEMPELPLDAIEVPEPPEPPLEERIDRALAMKEDQIRSEGSHRLQAIAAPYSDEERESWHKQEKEARAWLGDPTVSTPLISAMASSRGITLEDMVLKVMENVELFEQAAGAILGTQQKLLDELAVAQTLEEIEAISWPDQA